MWDMGMVEPSTLELISDLYQQQLQDGFEGVDLTTSPPEAAKQKLEGCVITGAKKKRKRKRGAVEALS
jgi:hypothetical protein